MLFSQFTLGFVTSTNNVDAICKADVEFALRSMFRNRTPRVGRFGGRETLFFQLFGETGNELFLRGLF
jgi:hypothetical protein